MSQLSLLEQVQLSRPGCTSPEAVIELAGEIIRDLSLEPPIDPKVVASHQGIAAIEVVPLPWAGCLLPVGDQLVVKVRERDGRGRRRFTIFHEVGHTFMPGFSYEAQFRCDPQVTPVIKDDIERLCDQAASELLFPRDFIVPDLVQADFGLDAVVALAQRYDASIHSTTHKFVSLWPEDSLFMILRRMRKPNDAENVESKLRVDAVRSRGEWPYVPRFKSIDSGHVLQRALEGEILDEHMDLSRLSSSLPKNLYASARAFSYRDQGGEMNDRVFVLVRKRSKRQRTGRPS